MPTSILKVKGIGPVTAEKLAAAGFTSAEELVAAAIGKVAAVSGFTEVRAKQVIADARKQLVGAPSAGGDHRDVTIASEAVGRSKGEKDKLSKKKLKKRKLKKDKADKKKAKREKQKKEKVKKDKAKKRGKKKKDKKKKK